MSNDHCSPITRENIQENIDQYGCFIVQVPEDDYSPSFAYTVGLHQRFGHPEIICFGLPLQLMGDLLNNACEEIRQGASFTTDTPYDEFLNNHPVRFLGVDQAYYPYYPAVGCYFYLTQQFPVLQMVWPDKQSLFPWETGFNPNLLRKQPLLDRNTDFMFQEERNLGVFTTRQVLEGKPILYVYHDEEGDWQFHSEQQPIEEDVRLVALAQIVKIDPGIVELHQLSYGQHATRATPEDAWERS
ncbi:DUF4262 domain-containing protein [Chitinophaga qingshengii]|uniref:DUF4262 domain-containing protein n=1 Tax=Chitinophaga qingshengii TaxID=1569794 RepID=A0ABR7TZ27_9BACT|nr:DUF4262 domain-containing protein [Chitinophaga qingshengii]MBC9934856.1 DUF4262 domain-containing protein [Chitinophaga qingshengii]